jgi:hypothetical protein
MADEPRVIKLAKGEILDIKKLKKLGYENGAEFMMDQQAGRVVIEREGEEKEEKKVKKTKEKESLDLKAKKDGKNKNNVPLSKILSKKANMR